MWTRFLKKGTTGAVRRVYLDHAAATPVLPAVLAAMLPYFNETFGNAGGIHKEGVAAKRALEEARNQVARTLLVQPSGVVFTSGGTESNNLALIGYVKSLVTSGRSYHSIEILSTRLEHPATLKTLDELANLGVVVTYVPVDAVGHIDMAALKGTLRPSVALVSLAYVNSEIGTITKSRDVRRLLDEYKKESGTDIKLHIDAAQAPLWLPCDLPRLGADLISLDAGKCGGPKGCGVLAFLKGVTLAPVLRGGGQEAGLRPGTEPLPLIVGMATALSLAQADHKVRSTRVASVRDYFLERVADLFPQAVVNGPLGDARVANNVHISLPGLDAEYAVIVLDAKGIAASTKSACSSKGGGESAVILAMTGDNKRALSTLRFTLGPDTKKGDIDVALAALGEHVAKIPAL